jgi:hypothetical protein
MAGALARWADEGGAQAVPPPSKYTTGAPLQQETGSNVACCAIENERIQGKWKRK